VPCVTKSWQTSQQGTNEPLHLMEKKSKVRNTKCTKITPVKSNGTMDYGVELEEIVKTVQDISRLQMLFTHQFFEYELYILG
jgi:hypothetical protein